MKNIEKIHKNKIIHIKYKNYKYVINEGSRQTLVDCLQYNNTIDDVIKQEENYKQNNLNVIITNSLALDLNHDRKINTTSLQNSNTYFDMDNSGTSEKTGWIDKGDGLLVFDENNDGKIDNINELFGNNEVEGYTELKQKFDSNNDNVIDNKDERFNELKVWIDANGDGVSQDGNEYLSGDLNFLINNRDINMNRFKNEIKVA